MNGRPLVTVFTPSYNRENCISKCYESLCAQTSYNFVWLIVDDGSTDNTDKLVQGWQQEQENFEIRYFWKENGGLHTAYNKAIELADTELFVCIDSDDWMPPQAIAQIAQIWEQAGRENYVGIMGIDRYENGDCVGDYFPSDVKEMYLYEKLTKYCLDGDKKIVQKTSLLKEVAPMPVFQGEKNFNPSYMMYQVDRFGKLYITNECFCIVDYQPDGMSSNIYKQYQNSPNSFAETRKLYLSFPDTSLAFKIRHLIHYASSCIIAKKPLRGIKESPFPFLSALCIIPGYLLTGFVLFKVKRK